MDNLFLELSLIIIVATAIAGAMQLLRQPLIIGHIITGLLVGPYFFNILRPTDTIDLFSQLGIALLLFIIGLSLSPTIIREVGKVSLITGVGQVVFTALVGFFIVRALGYSPLVSLYIAIALTFSSTIIILKLLSDKNDLNRLYGKISTGFLLVQDLIATVILMIVSALGQQKDLATLAAETAIKGAILFAVLFFATVFILPRLAHFFARSQEFLFLFAISWGLGLAALFHTMGFSIEIGGLFAGIALATSPYHFEISARLRPLRDFFIVLFFILLGSQLIVEDIQTLIPATVILSLFILIGNPLIVMILVRFLGYSKKIGFQAGLTVAQISEFSLILVVLANKIGHLPQEVVALVTMVGLVTIAGSTYLILYSDQLYDHLAPYLSIFEPRRDKKKTYQPESYEIVLFGYDQVGYDLIRSFRRLGKEFLVVDYNPEIIDKLTKEGINCRYGDANDNEFLKELGLERTKMIVSTIVEAEASQLLLKYIRRINKKAIIIVKSDNIAEAAALYNKGATYVMMPHYISVNHTSELIGKHGFDFSQFIKERDRHVAYLKRRTALSQRHPSVVLD